MKTIRKILAPTDLSSLSSAGIGKALEMAAETGAEVIVYLVVTPNELIQFGVETDWRLKRSSSAESIDFIVQKYESSLDRFLQKNHSNMIHQVDVRKIIELGSPSRNIIEVARREGVDLIIISTHGRTGFSHMLLGSVAEKVVRQSPCPVLTIRPRAGKTGEENPISA